MSVFVGGTRLHDVDAGPYHSMSDIPFGTMSFDPTLMHNREHVHVSVACCAGPVQRLPLHSSVANCESIFTLVVFHDILSVEESMKHALVFMQ